MLCLFFKILCESAAQFVLKTQNLELIFVNIVLNCQKIVLNVSGCGDLQWPHATAAVAATTALMTAVVAGVPAINDSCGDYSSCSGDLGLYCPWGVDGAQNTVNKYKATQLGQLC